MFGVGDLIGVGLISLGIGIFLARWYYIGFFTRRLEEETNELIDKFADIARSHDKEQDKKLKDIADVMNKLIIENNMLKNKNNNRNN